MDGRRAQEALDLARSLVRIPSENPVGSERACAEFVAGWLEQHGVSPCLDEVQPGRPNVVARVGEGPEPPLVFVAHLDTVPAGEGWSVDPFSAEVRDGRLYGRGAADMKGGVAAALVAFREAATVASGRRPVVFLGTVDEEGPHMLGITRLIEQGHVRRDSLVVCTEPTDLRLILAHKGAMWYRIRARGRMSHAGNPHLGVDANHGLVATLLAVKEAIGDLPHEHPLLGRPSVTIGYMAGGFKTNVVPDQAVAEVDVRLVPPMAGGDAEAILAAACRKGEEVVRGVRLEWERMSRDRPPVEADPSSPVAEGLRRAFRVVTGRPVVEAGYPAYTDAAMVAAALGNDQWVLFGPGHLDQAHTVDEWAEAEQIGTAAEVLVRLVGELA
ncbi:MAG TPA: M20 family metallopeptidase [Chloroflexota bacterium]